MGGNSRPLKSALVSPKHRIKTRNVLTKNFHKKSIDFFLKKSIKLHSDRSRKNVGSKNKRIRIKNKMRSQRNSPSINKVTRYQNSINKLELKSGKVILNFNINLRKSGKNKKNQKGKKMVIKKDKPK